jgi:hypothetical protein
MSTLSAIKLGGEVHKDRSVSVGGFSLNGHNSSHIMSEKESCAQGSQFRPQNNMQSIDFHNPAGQNTTPVFLFGDYMSCRSELSLAISLLKFSTSLPNFKIHGTVHRNMTSSNYQQDATQLRNLLLHIRQ